MSLVKPEQCTLCEIGLHKKGGVAVPGEGNPKATIMLLGMAPGKTEAQYGRPFVGLSGQDQDVLLKLAEIDRQDIYLTNICKCWPYEIVVNERTHAFALKNRDPNRQEIANCHKFLAQEIDIIRPKVIVALGALALSALEGKAPGSIIKRMGIPSMHKATKAIIMPTLHPSYVHRNGGVYAITGDLTPSAKEVVAHLKEAKKLSLNPDLSSEKKYLLVDNREKFRHVMKTIKEKKRCTFDVETEGLLISHKIIGIGLGVDVRRSAYIPFLVPKFMGYGLGHFWADKDISEEEVVKGLKEVLEDPEIGKSGHDCKFDMRQLRIDLNISVDGLIWDSMCGAYLLDENGSHRLDALKDKYPDLLGYSDKWNEATGHGKHSENASLEIVSDYCCGDNDATLRLTQEQMTIFQKHPNFQWFMASYYIPLMYFVADFERVGVMYDRKRAQEVGKHYEEKANKLRQDIYRFVGLKFNINTPDEVAKVLYTLLKLKPIKYTKGGKSGKNKKPSTDAEVLKHYAEEHPVPKMIIDYRHATKMKSTYIDNMLAQQDANGRVHISLHPTGTVTGRFSGDGNQNVPKETMIKSLFIAPVGSKLVQADLSQAEVRCFVHYANEVALIKAFLREKIDIHSMVASLVARIPYEDFFDRVQNDDLEAVQLRQAAKTLVFGILYGMGKESVAKTTEMTLDETTKFIEKFFKTFSSCKRWIDNIHKQVEIQGYVSNLFGRIRRLPSIYSDNEDIKAQARRQAVNSIIQSTAADITNLSLIRIHQKLKTLAWPAQIVLTVHDSIVVEATDEYVQPVSKLMVETMEMKPTLDFKVKMRADVDIYQAWGEKLKK